MVITIHCHKHEQNILIWNPSTFNTGNKICIACRSKIILLSAVKEVGGGRCLSGNTTHYLSAIVIFISVPQPIHYNG